MADRPRTINDYVSKCHYAPVTTSAPAPDFLGEFAPAIGTAYFICTECEEPCDADRAS